MKLVNKTLPVPSQNTIKSFQDHYSNLSLEKIEKSVKLFLNDPKIILEKFIEIINSMIISIEKKRLIFETIEKFNPKTTVA